MKKKANPKIKLNPLKTPLYKPIKTQNNTLNERN